MTALRAARTSLGRRLRAAVFGLWVALVAGSSADASPPPAEARVALVTANAESTTTTRLRAELAQLGVSVVVIVAGEETPVGRVSLENIARTAGAFAAVRVVPVAAEVDCLARLREFMNRIKPPEPRLPNRQASTARV